MSSIIIRKITKENESEMLVHMNIFFGGTFIKKENLEEAGIVNPIKLEYYKIINEDEFIKLSKQIYDITDFICEDYPKHKEWYFHKQIPRIFTPSGEILFARSEEDENKIIAMACLKKDEEEQKICTLYVSDQCRGQHLGTRMVEASMEFLGTTKPLITLADYKLPMFQPIIEKYDWELTEVVSGLYNDRAKELCFNGKLTKDVNLEQSGLTLTKKPRK